MEKKQWAGEEYFSYYPNTYFLMLLEHVIWYLIGKPNIEVLTIVLNILNYLLIDSGIYTLYRVSKKYINLVVAKTAALLSIIFIGVSPWGCLTYSDPLAFSLSIFSISLLLSLRFSTTNRKYMYSVLIGFLMVIDYLIKPSLVILFIAAIIVTLPLLKKLIKSERLSIIIIAMTVMASYGCYLAYRNNNSFVTFDSSKSFSMTHFADMGTKNNGGYSQEDTVRDMQILDSKERQRADIQDWVTEFNRKGLTGYQVFLIRKQILNTSDASFAWGNDGEPFIRPYCKSNFAKLSRKLFIPKYNSALKAINDILWIITLIFMLFSLCAKDWITLLLKYVVLGFALFLLLFEGGRSRYLIQFLPYVFLLSGIGFYKLQKILDERIKLV